MSRTLIQAVNAGLQSIGEPQIDTFTSDDLLEGQLIDEVNYAVRMIQNRYRFEWTFGRDTLTTTDDVTSEYVAATNGSTAITSVDEDGADAAAWDSLEAGMYIRIGSDEVSYKIDSVDTTSTPHTAVMETAYVGDTTTSSSYVAMKDEYAISISDFEDIYKVLFSGGAGSVWSNDNELDVIPLSSMIRKCGGDFHGSKGGIPLYIARFGIDSNDYPVYKVWPYPTDEFVFEILYYRKYSTQSTASSEIFGSDAPEIAYDIVEKFVKAKAFEWDRNINEKASHIGSAMGDLNALITREHLSTRHQMKIKPGRRRGYGKVRRESQTWFDRL